MAHVAWIINTLMDIYHMDCWKMLHITRMVNQSLQVYRFQWCLSLHVC